MFVDGFAFAFASAIVGVPKFAEEKIFKTGVMKSRKFGVGVIVGVVEMLGAIRILVEH